jgi:hypothetical protein
MNKIMTGICFCAMMLASVSCQDKIDEEFLNPEKTTRPSIGKFFTYMIDNSRVRAEYWNIRTFLVMHPGVYTQSVSYLNTTRRYQQQPSYLDDYWRDYYTPTAGGVVAHLREIEKEYATLEDAEKANAEVYLQAARVLYFDQTAQMVDMWGDIPFSEAGSVNLTGEIIAPKFDNAEEIYTAILTGLEEAASYFSTASLDPLVASSFGKQDILLQGNLDKWRRYANSIRLRALMRISYQNESKAQADVMEMLNSPADYPLVDDAANNILLHPLTTYTDFMRNAVSELNSHVAPEYMLEEVLKPANDPRIRVLFDKNRTSAGVYNADYYAMPSDITSDIQEENIGKGMYAVLDSATFLFNTKFPGIVITSSEVNFLKAEAQERWGSTDEAQLAYEKGVTESVNFYFYLNQLGAGTESAVTGAELAALIAEPSVAYAGTTEEKLVKIWTQKWLSFGFMQSVQSWSDLRRTNYPVLTFSPDNSTQGYELPSTRLVYPPNEKTYNAENYSAVAGSDVSTGKIFWDVN